MMKRPSNPSAIARPWRTTGPAVPLEVGAAEVDITPPLEVGILMSSVARAWRPFEGVRMPLKARAVVIRQGGGAVGLISMELLGLADVAVGGMRRFKARVAAAAGGAVPAGRLILASIHTHSGPETLALTDLYRTPACRRWIAMLARQLGAAVRQAAQSLQPCRAMSAATHAGGLAIHRRIKTTAGVVLSHPPPPPETILSADGPTDDSVHVLAFVARDGRPVAILVNATCHPVHEMCIPRISPDYPGIMCAEMQRRCTGATVLFFNGPAGNINPPTVSGGPADAERHGHRLADVVEQALSRLKKVRGPTLRVATSQIELPGRTPAGRPSSRPVKAELAAIGLGETAWLFLPGEPFVEIGLRLRREAPCRLAGVVGYSNQYIGYVPTDEAFAEGGYELGPGRWARVGPGSSRILHRQAMRLLARL